MSEVKKVFATIFGVNLQKKFSEFSPTLSYEAQFFENVANLM